jgi:peptidoglycan/LPS O-acetylase OafA/YrhL
MMIKRLLYLNGLATVAVVLYHSSAWGFISMFWWADRYRAVSVPNFDQLGGLTYYALRMIEQVVMFAIPAFLFVSGYFVAVATRKNQPTIDWVVVFKRVKSLVIPFLLWSILILMANVLLGESYTTEDVIITIITGQTEPPYYYVPLLVQLYLLSPFLVPLAKNRAKVLLLVTAIVQLLIMMLTYAVILNLNVSFWELFLPLTKGWLFPGRIFFFTLGIVAGFHLSTIKSMVARIKWLLITSIIVLFIVGIIEWEWLLRGSGQDWIGPKETLIDQLYALAFILGFISLRKFKLPDYLFLPKLGARSFGVYLIHSPVLRFTARIVYHILPPLLAYQMLFQPLLIIMGLGIPLLLMAFVNRSPGRRYYEFAFG